jgi:hypothetical protein
VEGEAPDLAQSVLQVDFLLVVELHHVKLPVNIDKSSESVTVELVVSTGWMHPHLGKVESVVRDVKSLHHPQAPQAAPSSVTFVTYPSSVFVAPINYNGTLHHYQPLQTK